MRKSPNALAPNSGAATSPLEQDFLIWLADHYPVLTPTETNLIDSGRIIQRVRHDHSFEARKLRDLHLDVLIALTALTHGVRLITSNRADFELIREYRKFKLEVW
jgi:predicted nucleic acid-binding protein